MYGVPKGRVVVRSNVSDTASESPSKPSTIYLEILLYKSADYGLAPVMPRTSPALLHFMLVPVTARPLSAIVEGSDLEDDYDDQHSAGIMFLLRLFEITSSLPLTAV